MTISRKLYLSLGGIIGLVTLLGAAAWVEFSNIHEQITASAASTHKLALAAQIQNLSGQMLSLERGMIARTQIKDYEGIDEYHASFQSDLSRRQAVVKEYLDIATSAAAKEILQGLIDGSDNRLRVHDELYNSCKSGDANAAEAVVKEKLVAVAAANQSNSDKLQQISTQQVTDDASATESAIATGRWIVGVILLLSVVVSCVVVFVVRQINQALTETVSELSSGAEQIASAATQVSSSSQSLAQGSSEQAASLEESSASAEEINSMAHRTTEDTGVMTTVVSSSQRQFVTTNQQLDEMVAAMDEINDSSSKISKIIKVIDEIAFQTNILALNAAVEAARAGQAGMGFAVVADEVRNLAQRCAQAARDTTGLIEDSVAKSSGGKTKLGLVAASIKQTAEEFTKVKMLVDQVAHGSGEQAHGIDQIRTALGQMEQVTQSTAASAEESAAAAEQLSAQSEALKDLVTRLNKMVGGGAGHNSNYELSMKHGSSRSLQAPTTSRPSSTSRVLKPSGPASHSMSSFPLAGDPVETI